MAAAVARQERHALPFQRADDDGVGGIAERRLDADFARVGEARHGVQAAAADDADLHLRLVFRAFRALAALAWRIFVFCAAMQASP